MTRMLLADDAQALAKHHDSMMQSLARRLEVARASNNQQLVQLLEQERRAITGETSPSLLQTLAVNLKDWVQDLVKSVKDNAHLQVQQIESGGDRWWYAYDPQTGASVYADSDTELLIWINEHYQGR